MHPSGERSAIHASIGIWGLLLVVVLTPSILECLLLLLLEAIVPLKPVREGVRPPLAVICRSLLLRLSLTPQRLIQVILLLLAIQIDLLRRRHTEPVLVRPPSVIVIGSLLRPILLLLRPPICRCLGPSWFRLEV